MLAPVAREDMAIPVETHQIFICISRLLSQLVQPITYKPMGAMEGKVDWADLVELVEQVVMVSEEVMVPGVLVSLRLLLVLEERAAMLGMEGAVVEVGREVMVPLEGTQGILQSIILRVFR